MSKKFQLKTGQMFLSEEGYITVPRLKKVKKQRVKAKIYNPLPFDEPHWFWDSI